MSTASQPPGTFILSFDCEGKFGIADHLTPELEVLLRDESNTGAYRAILAELDRNDMRATFAFVGAFTLHPDEYDGWRNDFAEEQVAGRAWLRTFYRDAAQGRFEGWFNPRPLKLVRQAGGHELGTHGFTHLPLEESIARPEIFDREMAAVVRLARQRGYAVRTIVYPRNQIGHTARLAAHGLVGFRAALHPAWFGPTRRVRNVLAEFNIMERSQPAKQSLAPPVAVPSGHILNYRYNLARRVVPRAMTLARWTWQLDHAARTGGVVHLWSHPENFLIDPGLTGTFGQILAHASRLVKEGRLSNHTMAEYCDQTLRV